MTRSHIISFRKSVLCNHYISILQSRNSIKKNKNSIKNWKYLIFSHTNRSDSLTEFSQIRKVRICTFCVDVCSQKFARIRCNIFFIDFSIIFNFWHRIDIFYELSTIKSHRNRFIDVAKNIWEFWNSQWCYMMWFAFSFVIAKFKHKIFVSWYIVYSISNINFRIDVSFHENSKHDRNFSDARSHVLQFDFTSYLESTDSSNLDSFVSAIFASMYDLILQNLHRWKSHIAEEVASLKKLHRWKSLHENSRSDWTR